MIHRYEPTRFYNAFGSYEPALRIADGDTVVTTTIDARGYDQRGEQRASRGNPLTGPFYVEGAEPGDALEVRIERIWPNRADGWSGSLVAMHVIEPQQVREFPYSDSRASWAVDIAAGTATLVEPQTVLGRYTLPLAPMLGCIGVAPAGKQAIAAATSGQYGGNMDYRQVAVGACFTFPVFEPGALLFVGDGHATQGDGEIVGTGIEVSMDVQFTVKLRKGYKVSWPRGENADYLMALGNARPLDAAVQHATSELLRWLQTDYGLDPIAASCILGQCVEYDLGNVFDPAYTMVCKLAKKWLPAKE